MIESREVSFLTLAGELDVAAVDGLRAALARLETSDVAILDFSGVTFCDSTAIGSLVRMRDRMIEGGRAGEVRIVGADAMTRRVFAICGLDAVFALHDDLRSAGVMTPGSDGEVAFVGGYDAGSLEQAG